MKTAFLFFLFLGFALPSAYIIPLGFALEYRELALIFLPIINSFIQSENRVFYNPIGFKRVKKTIYAFIVVVLITEFLLKFFLFNQSVGDGIKCIRLGLPLFSGLLLLTQGLRVNVMLVWRTLLLAVLVSVLLSFVNLFVSLPFSTSLSDNDVERGFTGRIGNLNFSFGIIGLYLLMEKKNEFYLKGGLVARASSISVVALVGAFNRTYLAVLLLEFALLLFRRFTVKKILKMTFLFGLLFSGMAYFYESNSRLQNQIDKRIFSILSGDVSIEESAIENNRDHIVEGVRERISEGYWIIGLPYRTPIYVKQARFDLEEMYMSKIDTSLVNLLLRYGIFPFVLLGYVFIRLIKYNIHMFNFIFFLFLIASLNIDALFSHNSVFFVLFLFMISTHTPK